MKKTFLLIVLSIVVLALSACSNMPKGEPMAVLDQYFQSAVIDGDYESAYNQLCMENQSQLSLEEYKDWYDTLSFVKKVLSFNIVDEEVQIDYKYDVTSYEYAYEYTITLKVPEYFTGKEVLEDTIYYIVSENNEWKVLTENNLRTKYSGALFLERWHYRIASSHDIDINIFLEDYLHAIEIDPDDPMNYEGIVYIYLLKQQYDKALEYANIGIEKTTDVYLMSNLYNLKGMSYYYSYNYTEAEAAFEKALEYNPDSIYAIDSIQELF